MGDPWPFVHRRNHTGSVDILNGVYAFTDTQLGEFFRLCPLLGIDDPKSLMNGEDIVLSFSGDHRQSRGGATCDPSSDWLGSAGVIDDLHCNHRRYRIAT